MGSNTTSSEISTVFDILRDAARRRLIRTLVDHPEARLDERLLVTDGGDEEVSHIQSRLYHIHLPKLEAAGVIEWDRETGEIHRGPNFDEVQDVLEIVEAYKREK